MTWVADKDEPRVLPGEGHLDDRGALTCCNEFDLGATGVRRVYFVRNWTQGFVRAWHGHLKADTWLWPVDGVWKISAGLMLIDSERGYRVSLDARIRTFVVGRGSILHVPPGWFHGHQNLTRVASLAVFSSTTLEEVKVDDVRLPWDQIPGVWEVQPR